MKTVHIGDLGEIKTGSTPSKKNPDNYGDYALWIKPTDINPDEKYTRVVEEMFSEKAAIDCRSRLIPANSICVPCIGTVGTKLTMTPCDCFVNQSINAVIPNEDYDNDYVYYLLLNFLPNLKSINKGTASGREYIAKSAFENIEIKVHSDIEVQRSIGQILSAYDDMIENCKKQIALLEEAAQRLYREWFVDLRFPGHETTPLGENGLPEGWKSSKLGDICSYQRGVSYTTPELGSGNIFVNLKNIASYGGYNFGAEKLFSGKFKICHIVDTNDLVMGITDMTSERRCVGHVALIPEIKGTKIISPDLIKLCPQIPKRFLYSQLRFGGVSRIISQSANGTNVAHLKPEQAMNTMILVPNEEIMNQFELIISFYTEIINNLLTMASYANKTKQLLLPRLISGQIEINA